MRACLFFFLSGATALVYEVVWVRYLSLIFGNTTHAVSTVLCAYMAGLGAGSYLLGGLADRAARPLRVYGFLEAGVGFFAALTPAWLFLVQEAYVAFSGACQGGAPLLALRLVLSFPVVFIPTFLMGGTLPVLAKYFVGRSEEIGSRTAFLYALNIAGAVCGTFAAGFWLLPSLGAFNTLVAAVIVNLGVGLWATLLSTRSTSRAASPRERAEGIRTPAGDSRPLLAASAGLFVSGMTSMAYQISWTRTLASVLGSSTYAFTLMLGTFLLGLGLGSEACRRRLSTRAATWTDWAAAQALIAAFALATLPLFPWIGLWVVRLYGLTLGHAGWMQFFLLLACACLMLVPAACFGALFPLSTALAAPDRSRLGRRIGVLYFSNTLGNILGSFLTGFLAIPFLGVHRTLTLAAAAGAALVALPCWFVLRTQRWALAALAGSLLSAALFSGASGWDPRWMAGGLHIRPAASVARKTENILADLLDRRIVYYRDGLTCGVAVGEEAGIRFLKVNGKVDASTGPSDVRTQLLLGHLPHLFHAKPRTSLVIGFGGGQTLAAALEHGLERADCVEIEPAVYEAADYFSSINRGAHRDPRARLIVNDGRNHLLVGTDRYDVIISEPSNPWMAGISYLFTREFYRLVDGRLGPEGVFCQWIHSYAISPEDFRMVVATVRSVFPRVTLWRSNQGDYLILASRRTLAADPDELEARLDRSPRIREDLAGIGIRDGAAAWACFRLSSEDVDRYVAGSRLNTDDRLPLEYNAPRTLYETTHELVRDTLDDAASRWLAPASMTVEPLSSDPAGLASIGRALIEMEDFKRARKALSLALRLKPDEPGALVGMGRCLGAEGKHLEALEHFRRSGLPEARLYEARALLLLGDPAKALTALDGAGDAQNLGFEYAATRAQILGALGRQREAAAWYSAVRDPRPAHALQLKVESAAALRRSGGVRDALLILEPLVREHPTYRPLLAEILACYREASLEEKAVRLLRDLTSLNPYRLYYWIELVERLAVTGRDAEAASALEEARRRIPSLEYALGGSFRSLKSLEA